MSLPSTSAGTRSAAPPPSQQEVTRKLSVHSIARPHLKKAASTPGALSGGETSDSDSVFAGDVLTPSPLSAGMPMPPLSSIAERRRAGSGEESEEEDEEEDEGEWRAESREQAMARDARGETVLRTGYLSKKGERRKTWKKRWFVLRPAHLAFYKTSAEYKLLRLLDLSDVHSCTAVQLKKHTHTFCLVSPTRTFYLQASSPADVAAWVAAINAARTALQETSTQSSAAASAPIPIPRTPSQRAPQMHSAHSPGHGLTSSDSDDALVQATSPSRVPAALDSSKVILSGYLMKCGSRRHTWHNRWFVLSGDRLVYSRSHMDTKPHRQLPLAQLLDALEYAPPPSPHPAGEDPGPHTFKIVTTKRALLLCAPSEEEEIRWLSAVRALIARRAEPASNGAPVPAAASAPAPPASAPAMGHRRRDSAARRLSLSGSVGLMGIHGHAHSGAGVSQEA